MAFTFIFRDRHTLESLSKLLTVYSEGFSRIKVWDAGAAMGPEPYTLAIILSEEFQKELFDKVMITASDIDEYDKYGETILNAVYPVTDLTRMPLNIFEKYFVPSDKTDYFRVIEPITAKIKFIKHDLLSLKPFEKNFHAVICKNVLLHFNHEQRIEVIKMFHDSLETGAYLVTEQTQHLPAECEHLFEKSVPDAHIYRKI
ncbi:MAG: CheR family methyltransferase [Candidatus Kapabacteria bacterium]|nr:CheR family methyltransferase [Candidatus Kapabacteria bacterium]